MLYRVAVLSLCLTALSAYAGTTPKAAAADYPAHTRLDTLAIGAEYTVHSFSGDHTTFIADDYLVVEVALYPDKGECVTVEPNDFSLRINGKRQMLAQAPEFVAPSLQNTDWQQPAPQAEDPDHPSPAQALLRAALPQGEVPNPVSGFLFFPYHGKTKSIRELELHYDGPAGKATIPLREAVISRTPERETLVPLRPGLR